MPNDKVSNRIPSCDEKTPLLKPEFDFSRYGIGIEDIKKEANQLLKSSAENEKSIGLFKCKSANQWIKEARDKPIPKMLFGKLWFEGELCILFADTNNGKSILAVQIADSITKGIPISGFSMEALSQTVIYFDFELSDKQLECRYSQGFTSHYCFNENFTRAEIDTDCDIPNESSFEEFLNDSLEQTIIETNSKIVIIDNITYLKTGTETAKDALPLMKFLQKLKKQHNLSILAIAHTPKRNLSKSLSRNDLQGSKMLINFCDSSFAIGESHNDKNLRYIRQIKARNTEIIYDSENVILCQISKSSNFLQFEIIGYGNEYEHLQRHTNNEKQDLIDTVKKLSSQGKTQRKIASELQISVGAVNKYLNYEEHTCMP